MDIRKINVARMQGGEPVPATKKEARSAELETWKEECKREARRLDAAFTALLALAFLGGVALAYFATCLLMAAFGVL